MGVANFIHLRAWHVRRSAIMIANSCHASQRGALAHSGAVTHHQDHSITAHIFRIRNTMNNKMHSTPVTIDLHLVVLTALTWVAYQVSRTNGNTRCGCG